MSSLTAVPMSQGKQGAPVRHTEKNKNGDGAAGAPEDDMPNKPQSNTGIVSILVSILLFMLVQTAGIAFWAGGVCKSQDVMSQDLKDLKSKPEERDKTIQTMSMKMAQLENERRRADRADRDQ